MIQLPSGTDLQWSMASVVAALTRAAIVAKLINFIIREGHHYEDDDSLGQLAESVELQN